MKLKNFAVAIIHFFCSLLLLQVSMHVLWGVEDSIKARCLITLGGIAAIFIDYMICRSIMHILPKGKASGWIHFADFWILAIPIYLFQLVVLNVFGQIDFASWNPIVAFTLIILLLAIERVQLANLYTADTKAVEFLIAFHFFITVVTLWPATIVLVWWDEMLIITQMPDVMVYLLFTFIALAAILIDGKISIKFALKYGKSMGWTHFVDIMLLYVPAFIIQYGIFISVTFQNLISKHRYSTAILRLVCLTIIMFLLAAERIQLLILLPRKKE